MGFIVDQLASMVFELASVAHEWYDFVRWVQRDANVNRKPS
jgi:hypothetical protein